MSKIPIYLTDSLLHNSQKHHPDTGLPYGGLQGYGQQNICEWAPVPHQVWSATGYLSNIYYQLLGADIQAGSVTFTPALPTGVNEATVNGFRVGNTTFDVIITRGGDAASAATYETTAEGNVTVRLSVK